MGFIINGNRLASRTTRLFTTGGDGVREITLNGNSSNGNLVSRIFGFFLGEIWERISAVFGFSWTALWGALVQGTVRLYNFNWDISDAQIQQQFESFKAQMAGQLGQTLGESLGWLVCGALPATTMVRFNPRLAAHVYKNVREEAVDEIAGQIASMCQMAFTGLIGAGALFVYQNLRRALKDPSNPLGQALRGIVGDQAIDGLGDDNVQNWSLAEKVEQQINTISDTVLRTYVENLVEGFFEGCVEAGFVVASSLDSFFQQNNQRQNVITIRASSADEYVVSANRGELPEVIRTTLNNHDIMTSIVNNQRFSAPPSIAGYPALRLFFLEDMEDVEEGYQQVKGEITIRIIDNNFNSINDIEALGRKTLSALKGVYWQKGREMLSYYKYSEGYRLRLLCRSSGAGLAILRSVLSIQGHTLDMKKANHTQTLDESGYPIVPPNAIILGTQMRQARQRPVASVKFFNAYLKLPNYPRELQIIKREKVVEDIKLA